MAAQQTNNLKDSQYKVCYTVFSNKYQLLQLALILADSLPASSSVQRSSSALLLAPRAPCTSITHYPRTFYDLTHQSGDKE